MERNKLKKDRDQDRDQGKKDGRAGAPLPRDLSFLPYLKRRRTPSALPPQGRHSRRVHHRKWWFGAYHELPSGR